MKYLDANLKIVGRSVELREAFVELRKAFPYTYQTEAWKKLFTAATDALCELEGALVTQAVDASNRDEKSLKRGVDALPKDR